MEKQLPENIIELFKSLSLECQAMALSDIETALRKLQESPSQKIGQQQLSLAESCQ